MVSYTILEILGKIYMIFCSRPYVGLGVALSLIFNKMHMFIMPFIRRTVVTVLTVSLSTLAAVS